MSTASPSKLNSYRRRIARVVAATVFAVYGGCAAMARDEARPQLSCPKTDLKPLGPVQTTARAVEGPLGILFLPLLPFLMANDALMSDGLASQPKGKARISVKGPDGRPAKNAIIAVIHSDSGRFLMQMSATDNPITLPVGEYIVNAIAEDQGSASKRTVTWGDGRIKVREKAENSLVIRTNTAFSNATPPALLTPVAAGATMNLEPPGNALEAAVVAISPKGKIDVAQSRSVSSWPAKIQAPSAPGAYLVSIVACAPTVVVGQWPLEVAAPNIRLAAPDTIAAGAEFNVRWSGDGSVADFIGYRAKGQTNIFQDTFKIDEKSGSTTKFVAPFVAGEYELVYGTASDGGILATRPLRVTPAAISLRAPETIALGEEKPFQWPSGNGNHAPLEIWTAGSEPARLIERIARPGAFQLIIAPGSYQLRLGNGSGVHLSRAINVTPPDYFAGAPWTAAPGETLVLRAAHRPNIFDRLVVAGAGAMRAGFEQIGAPQFSDTAMELRVPELPGRYELVYVTGISSEQRILARAPLTVVAPNGVAPILTAPDSVGPIETALLSWPDPSAYVVEIWSAQTGVAPTRRRTFEDAGRFPLALIPGAYEVRLKAKRAEGAKGANEIVARKKLTVRAERILRDVPTVAQRGTTLSFGVVGAPTIHDKVSVVKAGGKGRFGDDLVSVNAASGEIEAPDKPGRYDLIYSAFSFDDHEDVVLDRAPFIVK